MKVCELLAQCTVLNEEPANMPSTARALKSRYCLGSGCRACARYIIFRKLGKEKIPADLLPNQHDRVLDLLGFL